MIDIFKIGGTITLNGADKAGKAIESIANKAGNAAKTLGKTIAAVTGVATSVAAAVSAAAASTASYGDSIDKMSQKMGMSATAYQEWAAVMQHCGTSMESLQAGMKTLANAVESGNDAFDRLGITQEQIAEMSNEELFSATITALQKVDNETERTYLAGQLLGRGATELGALLNTSAEETQEMKDRVHELGGVMSDESVKASARFQDSLQDLKTTFSGLKNNLMTQFLPGIADVMDGLASLIIGEDGAIEKIESGITNAIGVLTAEVPEFFESLGNVALSLVSSIAEKAPQIIEAVTRTLDKLIPKILDVAKGIIPAVVKSLKSLIDNIDGTVIAIAGAFGAFKSLLNGNWVGVGIGLITAAFGLSKKAAQKHKEEIWGLTDAEKELIEAGKEAADTINAAKEARDENIGAVLLETEKTKDLWKELQTLVDENGNVLGSNHERVDYILGELNNALGTEYALNGNLIGQYDTMVDKIDELIQKKQLSALLDAGKDTYADAVMNNGALWDRVTEEQEKVNNAQAALDEQLQKLEEMKSDPFASERDVKNFEGFIEKNYGQPLEEAKADRDEALAAAEANANTISSYNTAMELSAQGKTAEATAAFLSNYDPTEKWKAVDPEAVTGADAKGIMSGIQQLTDRIDTVVGIYGENPDGAIAGTLSGFKEDLGGMWATYYSALAKPFTQQPSRFVDAHGNLVAQARQEAQTTETTVNINVHADMDDLGVKIAQAINDAISGAMQAVGNSYRGGRTSHAY